MKDCQKVNVSDYNRDRPSKWDFTTKNGDDIDLDSLDGENNSEQENLMAIINSQSERLNQCLSLMNKKVSPDFREKFKIEYSESLGIPAFIAQIEEWASLNDQNEIRKL